MRGSELPKDQKRSMTKPGSLEPSLQQLPADRLGAGPRPWGTASTADTAGAVRLGVPCSEIF